MGPARLSECSAVVTLGTLVHRDDYWVSDIQWRPRLLRDAAEHHVCGPFAAAREARGPAPAQIASPDSSNGPRGSEGRYSCESAEALGSDSGSADVSRAAEVQCRATHTGCGS